MIGKKLVPTFLAIEDDEVFTAEFPGTGIIFKYKRISNLKHLELQEQCTKRGYCNRYELDRVILDECLLGWENFKTRDKVTGSEVDVPFEKKYKYNLAREICLWLAIKFLAAYVEIETDLGN